MDHTLHPLRAVLLSGLAVAIADVIVTAIRSGAGSAELHGAIQFFVLAAMITMTGEYVGFLSRRLRDRPAYYVREERTSSVLLREQRTNVVDATR